MKGAAMLTYAIIVSTAVLFGFTCAAIAKQKGKDPLRWFFIGAFLNVIALAIILLYERRQDEHAK